MHLVIYFFIASSMLFVDFSSLRFDKTNMVKVVTVHRLHMVRVVNIASS